VKATPRICVKPVSPVQQSNSNATIIAESEPDEALIKRIFTLAEDGLISLKIRPQGDNALTDALLLLLYGYRRIAQKENVFAVTLSRAAAQSAFQIYRLDRAMEPLKQFVRRGGQRRSTTYTLTSPGVTEAARLAMTLLE